MNEEKTIYAVSKTHWDREWYLDFQNFRIRLVTLMDNLLNILENDPNYVSFMMDGQIIPLEDYLSIRPERLEDIKRFVAEDRLVIGPWYVLPDEVLISGESHIRNWLMGERMSRDIGKKMNIGYLPDSFGHPSQMPQILKGLGMKWMTFWRGATEEVEKNEFFWQSPDGSEVLVNLMPLGYSTGAQFPDDPKILAARLDKFIDDFTPMTNTDMLYMSNGGDHLEAVPYLSEVIKGANELMKNGKIIHTTLEEFFKELSEKLSGKELKTIHGEMMGTHTAILLTSTLSTRMYLKQRNFMAQKMLENTLEPIHAFAALRGEYIYPEAIIREAWRMFMQNLPHDNICGCSIDQVHRDMMYRYDQVDEIADALLERCGSFYAGINTTGMQSNDGVVIFNTGAHLRSDIVTATVDLEPLLMGRLEFNELDSRQGGSDAKSVRKTTLNDMMGRKTPIAVRAFDGENEIPCTMHSAEVFTGKLILNPYTFPNQYCTLRCNISIKVSDVPTAGYKAISLIPVYEELESKIENNPEYIENEFFKVSVDLQDGSLNVLDKTNGVEYTGLARLEDSGDCGDEYSYCPPDFDSYIYADPDSIQVSITQQGDVLSELTISGVLHLPETVLDTCSRRSGRIVDCPFTHRVQLGAGINRIDIDTTLENNAMYHRLRVLFPAGFKTDTSYSAGAFSVDARPVEKPIDPNWQEWFTTNPQKEFCSINCETHGLTIANRGLPEYEVFNSEKESIIAVTLLRCVGEISKWKMKTRKDRGGWLVFTPEGQCFGHHSFQYSIIPHTGNWESGGGAQAAREFAIPLHPLPTTYTGEGTLPQTDSLFTLPEGLVVTAFKPCEFEEGYILRFYNTTASPIKGNLEFYFPAQSIHISDLREETVSELSFQDNKIAIDVAPWKIMTIKFKTLH